MIIHTRLRSARVGAAAAATALTITGLVAGGAALAAPASAATAHPGGRGAVFVQTDATSGNQVVAYDRHGDGTLTLAGRYATGGLGGILDGSVVDHLASQGSLQYDQAAGLLYAVNAGSNTVSVFSVRGDQLFLRQVIGSGGTFPVSIAVRGDLVYVLNATGGGTVQGYRVLGGRLVPIPGSARALGLDPTASPQFTNTPGQVAFTPGGRRLVVTTKANGNDIDVFAVGADGRLSAHPAINPEPGTVPFAITFDPGGHLVIAEAGPDALATFTISGDGTTSLVELGTDRPGGDLLGGTGRALPVRLQRGRRHGKRLLRPRFRAAGPARPDADRPGHGGRGSVSRRPVPVRPDRRSGDRRRVRRAPGRLADPGGQRHGRRRGRRRGHRGGLICLRARDGEAIP